MAVWQFGSLQMRPAYLSAHPAAAALQHVDQTPPPCLLYFLQADVASGDAQGSIVHVIDFVLVPEL